MQGDKSEDLLIDVRDRMEATSAAIDEQIASDDPEVSYAATTAALHLHAAQAELTAPGFTGIQPPSADHVERSPDRAVDALADLVATINDRVASVPAERQAAVTRVALYAAEARDALGGTST